MPDPDRSSHVLALPAIDDQGRYFAGCRTCGAILRAPTLPELVPLIGGHLGAQPVVVPRPLVEPDPDAELGELLEALGGEE